MQARGLSPSASQKILGVEREQPRPAQPTIIPHMLQYELEFENSSSTRACELFADTTEHASRNRLEVAGKGNSARRRSTARSTSHSTTRTSSHFLHPQPTATPATRYCSPSPSRSSTLGAYTSRPIQTSPEREKRDSREEVALLRRVPEDGDAMEFPPAPSQSNSRHVNGQEDGGYDNLSRTPAVGSTPQLLEGQSLTMGDDGEEEEEQWVLDEELGRQGLYQGSYHQLIGLYSLTPAFTFLVFLSLAYLPRIAYPSTADEKPDLSYEYSPFFPFPLPEISTAIAFWALSHLLSSFTFSVFSFILADYPFTSLSLGSLLQSLLALILREAIVPILLIPSAAVYDHPTWRDGSFRRTWWIALGWAAAEAVVGLKQGYDGIALYRDVLVNVRRVVMTPNQSQKQQNVQMSGYGSITHEIHEPVPSSRQSIDVESRPLLENRSDNASDTAAQSDARLKDAIEDEVERDIDELIALRGREELEDLYGMPFIHIPVFISCLHRLNSVLFVLGSTLLLTAAYMRSSLSLGPSNSTSDHLRTTLVDHYWVRPYGDTQLLITAPLLVVLQWVLSILHTPQVLPRIGIQTFVYIGLMVSLGVFFAGLGVWEGIV